MSSSREEIRGLALLRSADPIAYGQERKAVAEKLGCRLRFLDEAVEIEARRLAVEAEPAPKYEPDDLLVEGEQVLDAPNVLVPLRRMLRKLGYAGPTAGAELVWLAIHSRLLDRPVNLLLEGPSAAGKTHTLETAAQLHPREVLHDLTGTSERAFVYTERDFEHTVVAIAEAAALHQDGIGASILRSLAWGKGIRYETVEKIDGALRARVVEKPGPTGLITTTTKDLDPEIATRLLAVPIADSNELTRAVMRAQAEVAAGNNLDVPDTGPWIAAARWLQVAGEHRVVVPFATVMAEIVPDDDVRMRRDFAQVLTLIKTLALVHQRSRERDDYGRVVALEADYEAARLLLAGVLAASMADVPDTVRETVAAVAALVGNHLDGVPVAALAEYLNLNRKSAFRRAKAAISKGYLIDNEDRPGRGRPLKIVLGDPLPVERVVLPPLPEDECPSAQVPRETWAPGHKVQGAERDTVSDEEGRSWTTATPDDVFWSEGGRDTIGDEDDQ
jgi:hypothetical protein